MLCRRIRWQQAKIDFEQSITSPAVLLELGIRLAAAVYEEDCGVDRFFRQNSNVELHKYVGAYNCWSCASSFHTFISWLSCREDGGLAMLTWIEDGVTMLTFRGTAHVLDWRVNINCSRKAFSDVLSTLKGSKPMFVHTGTCQKQHRKWWLSCGAG